MAAPLALKITDLKKQYRNGKVALKGINLEVKEGDFFALLGPNGAGKSTTIGIITDLVEPTSGHVEVFGVDTKKNKNLAKSMIGLVPQEFNFNPFEPCEEIVINQAGYLGIPRAEAKKRTTELLALLDLTDKAKVMARELSGGMKRRLMIARALVHNPKLLILDEPTAGVDIEIRRQTWDLMQKVNAAGTTIILTTHYLEEAEQMCKNIAIINHGEIVQQSSMSALLRELQSESFILSLSDHVHDLPLIEGISLKQIDSMTLEAEITKPYTINDLFMGLNTKSIKIDTMRNKANRLEELFLRITSKPLDTHNLEGAKMSNRAYWIAFYTIITKEIYRFVRIWPQTLLPPLITTILYFLIFGKVVGERVGSMDGVSYAQFIAPGLIMMTVISNSYSNVVSSFFSAKYTSHIEEMLVAPVPNLVIIAGYVMGGVARGLAVGGIVTIVALFFIDMTINNIALMILIFFLTSLVFSLAGLINAIFARSFDDISIIPTFILTPLTYLGGVFYSVSLLPGFWQNISYFNPVLYMVSAFRHSILGVSDINIWTAIILLLGFFIVLFSISYYLLNRGIGLKS